MKYFFTADEHYGHENIIKYCNRPFKTVDEMDNEIIRRHNEVVGINDTVIHCGDFSLAKKIGNFEKYFNRLNGKHQFILGSHDYWSQLSEIKLRSDMFIADMLTIKVDEICIVCCHYAMRTWPYSHYGSIQVYGHSHGKLPPLSNQWDVGVDNNNFYPVSLEELINKINV